MSCHCLTCPVRSQCTRSKVNPRGLTLMIREDYEALADARIRQTTAEFKQQYFLRSGIEGTISQGVRGFELRQSRYIGLAKTRLQHILTAAAINKRENLCLARRSSSCSNSYFSCLKK